MPCTPFSTQDGGFGFLCGPGGYKHLVMAKCPWCCLGQETRVHAFREVFGGWESPDLLCGECGQYHTDDHAPKLKDEDREENKAKVQALQDAGVQVGPWPMPSAFADEMAGGK